MLTKTLAFSSSDNFKIMNPPYLSGITFSTLKFTQGLISVITPLLWFVLWLKKALPPHSFSQMVSRFLEQYDSRKNMI